MLAAGDEVWAWNDNGIKRIHCVLLYFQLRNHKVLVDKEVCFFDNVEEIKEVEMTHEEAVNELEKLLGIKIKIK